MKNSELIGVNTVPSAMVLVYQSELRTSVWMDLLHRCRTLHGLEKQLRAGVRSGEWVAWRLIRIDRQVFGNQE